MADKDLRLVTQFNREHSGEQYGYQMVDDTTVLERKELPIVVFSNTDSSPWGVWISVYDFKSCQLMSYVQDVYDRGQGASGTPAVTIKSFSEVEGKEAIVDAFMALQELGGHPTLAPTVIDAIERDQALAERQAAAQKSKDEAKREEARSHRYPSFGQ